MQATYAIMPSERLLEIRQEEIDHSSGSVCRKRGDRISEFHSPLSWGMDPWKLECVPLEARVWDGW